MTYVVAWKNKTSVFICADSVVTREGKNPQPLGGGILKLTTMGEPIYKDAEKVSQEAAVKVFDIGGRMIVSFAGRMQPAIQAIESMEEEFEKFREREDYEEVILRAIGPVENRNSFSMVVGYIKNGAPKLYVWNQNSDGQIQTNLETVQLGSFIAQRQEQASTTEKIMGALLEATELSPKISDVVFLVYTLASLQSYGIQESSLKIGVGGVFGGIRIDKAGIEWAPDITHVVVDLSLRITRIVNLRFRNKAMFVLSTNLLDDTPGISAFYLNATKVNTMTEKELCAIRDKVNKQSETSNSRYFNVLTENPIWYVIDNSGREKYLSWEIGEDGFLHNIGVTQKLIDRMVEDVDYNIKNGIGARFAHLQF